MNNPIEATVVGEEVIISEEEIERAEELHADLQALVSDATSITVSDDSDYVEAVEMLQTVERVFDIIESLLDPLRARAYQHYKDVLGYKKSILHTGEYARDHLRQQIKSYAEEQDREKTKRIQSGEADWDEMEEDPIPEVEGFYHREKWNVDVVDKEALVRAVANGDANLDYLDVNTSALRKDASSLQESFNIPGVEVTKELVPVNRG